jgi:hypothetical protein
MRMLSMRTEVRKHSSSAVLAALGLMAFTSVATAQTLSGGSVSGTAGRTVAVPITINTGSANVAFFAATFTVVPQGDAPAITGKLDYKTASGVPAPDLKAGVQAQAKLAIGYAGVTIKPPLKGKLRIGSLMVPIPSGAKGSYEVQLSKISAGDSSGGKVDLTTQNGAIKFR